MIRPWHRSRLFWLGIPCLLFLLWVWWQSNYRWVETYLEPGWICSSQGELVWHDSTLPPSFTVNAPERGFTRIESSDGSFEAFGTLKWVVPPSARWDTFIRPVDPEESRWFPPPRWQVRKDSNGEHFRLRSVPYWLLTGGYAGLWLGGLARWQRRKARLTKLGSAPPP